MRIVCAVMVVVASLAGATAGQAASFFAVPAFQTQWQQGETIAPNFWGPLSTARDGQLEPYAGAATGPVCPPGAACIAIAYTDKRTVQYFDKGRMEQTNGTLTNGLLAKELVTSQIQTGDATFENRPPPTIAIAGDPSNIGPTYPMAAKAENTLYTAGPGEPTFPRAINRLMRPNGDLVPFDRADNYPDVQITSSDSATVRPVANVFAAYRDRVGLATIGYAITAPFWVNVTVGGAARDVLVQAFERRVLTYTPANDPAFRVEMGNIGQHYYQWRYPNGMANAAVPPVAPAFSVTAKDGSALIAATIV